MSFNPRINLNVYDRTVWKKRAEIDPDGKMNWDEYAFNWAIEKGATEREAKMFAQETYDNLV